MALPPALGSACDQDIRSSVYSLNYQWAWGQPVVRAALKTIAEDFVVEEGFAEESFEEQLSGAGDHIYLQLRKRYQNTRWVAAQLAKLYEVAEKDVAYCGLKDRRALTTQWFSVRQPDSRYDQVGVDLLSLATSANASILPGCEVLQVMRHRRKLRRGDHNCNAFRITLRGFHGDITELEQRLATIAAQGVPNYFGEQRFGIKGANLVAAERILSRSITRHGRDDKWGLYISAARSQLFNQVLSARIEQGTWLDPADEELHRTGPLPTGAFPTGPLWGRGRQELGRKLAAFEAQVLAPYATWCHGLEHCGLKQERRALVLLPKAMTWRWQGQGQEQDLHLTFSLPPGTYATSVLRELALTYIPSDSVNSSP